MRVGIHCLWSWAGRLFLKWETIDLDLEYRKNHDWSKREVIPGHGQRQESSYLMVRVPVEIQFVWVKSQRWKLPASNWSVKEMVFSCSWSLRLQTAEPFWSILYLALCLSLLTTFSNQRFSLIEHWPEWRLADAHGRVLKEDGTKVLFLQRNMLSAEENNTSFIPNLFLLA